MKLIIFLLALVILFSPVYADDGRASGKITVVAEGVASTDAVNAREKAINDALRGAVMNAIGAFVSSTSTGSAFREIDDKVFVKAQGFAILDKVFEEYTTSDGLIRVKIQATVSTKPLAELLKGLGITREWKVAVVMDEPSASLEIEKALIKAGFRPVDKGWVDKLADDEAVIRTGKVSREMLLKIRREYGVDVLVVGDVSVESRTKIGKLYRSSAVVRARAFYNDTGELLTALDSKVIKTARSESAAANEALRASAVEVSCKLVDALLTTPADLTPFVTVKVSGFSRVSVAVRFEQALRELPGVRSVKRQRFTNGVDELNVYIDREELDSLVESLEEHHYMLPFNLSVLTWSKAMVTASVGDASPKTHRGGASYIVLPPKQ